MLSSTNVARHSIANWRACPAAASRPSRRTSTAVAAYRPLLHHSALGDGHVHAVPRQVRAKRPCHLRRGQLEPALTCARCRPRRPATRWRSVELWRGPLWGILVLCRMAFWSGRSSSTQKNGESGRVKTPIILSITGSAASWCPELYVCLGRSSRGNCPFRLRENPPLAVYLSVRGGTTTVSVVVCYYPPAS